MQCSTVALPPRHVYSVNTSTGWPCLTPVKGYRYFSRALPTNEKHNQSCGMHRSKCLLTALLILTKKSNLANKSCVSPITRIPGVTAHSAHNVLALEEQNATITLALTTGTTTSSVGNSPSSYQPKRPQGDGNYQYASRRGRSQAQWTLDIKSLGAGEGPIVKISLSLSVWKVCG